MPELVEVSPGHFVSCHLYAEGRRVLQETVGTAG